VKAVLRAMTKAPANQTAPSRDHPGERKVCFSEFQVFDGQAEHLRRQSRGRRSRYLDGRKSTDKNESQTRTRFGTAPINLRLPISTPLARRVS
jgi:hypothetical protein